MITTMAETMLNDAFAKNLLRQKTEIHSNSREEANNRKSVSHVTNIAAATRNSCGNKALRLAAARTLDIS